MTQLARTPITPVWAGLMLATALSLWVVSGHAELVLLIAFAKVALVGDYFMDLRFAPVWLRAAFYAWVLLFCSLVIVIYLLS